MKILIHSNAAHVSTGYGVQTSLFAPRFQKLGHEVAISAFYGLEGAGMTTPGHDGEPIYVYPKGFGSYGEDVMGPHAQHYGADIILSLIDAWVMRPDYLRPEQRWTPWYPVDMETVSGGLAPPIRERLMLAHTRIAMSQYGVKVTNQSDLDCEYAPHGYDASVYKPMPEYRQPMRELQKIPESAYLVGIVAANKGQPARKSWPQMLEAYAAFQKRHKDCYLYLHTTRGERGEMGGVNLPEMIRMFGIPEDRVRWADQYQLFLGYPPAHMSGLYNAFDCLLNVSMGEGFGVPVLEAQACGTPVVVGDWTAMSELCWEGAKVSKDDALRWWTPLAAMQWIPQPAAITEALNEVRACGCRAPNAAKSATAYDADHVAEVYWKPLLERVAERIEAEKPNRAARRAKRTSIPAAA